MSLSFSWQSPDASQELSDLEAQLYPYHKFNDLKGNFPFLRAVEPNFIPVPAVLRGWRV
jgi:hypothetical protein